MNVGMLWFDNDKKTVLQEKVDKAVDYYRRKYGSVPNLCMVHPSMLTAPGYEPDGKLRAVVIQAHRAIRPGHLWIGEDEDH